MSRFHINPDKGPMRCSAKEGGCPYGVDAPHFSDKEEAQRTYENILENENKPLQSIKKRTPTKIDSSKREFVSSMDAMDFEQIEEFANSSEENHKILESVITDREVETIEYYRKLAKVNPKNKANERGAICDDSTYTSLKRDYEEFRNQTAELVEAHTESVYYETSTATLDDDSRIGHASKVESYSPNTIEWLKARYNTVGGSDIGTLATLELNDKDKIPGYVKASMNRIERSKVVEPNQEDFNKQNSILKVSKSGALYRGTVWEKRVRDSYVKENPQTTIYDAKAQYKHPDRPWQVINLDGVISTRDDKKPNGILEIKTGGDPEAWKDGVPTSYRAQVLYYLNTTGLEFADVRARINDGETFDYRINKDDEVVEGSGVTMESYIKDRVSPWFEDLKSRRAQD